MWKKTNLPIDYQLKVIARAFLEKQLEITQIILRLQDDNLRIFFYNCITSRGYEEKYKSYINAKVEYGFTPLHVAVATHQPGQVKILLSQPQIEPNITENNDSSTAIHWAILAGFEDIAEILISNDKVNIDAQDKKGNTPLHLVCNNIWAYLSRQQFEKAKESCKLIKLLFEHEAKDDISNQDDETPSSMLANLIGFTGDESRPQAVREISAKLIQIAHPKIGMDNTIRC